jgi:type I restriction enzyme S subunit
LTSEFVSLESLCDVITKGTTPTQAQGYTEEGINFIRALSIDDNGQLNEDTFLKISKETNADLRRSIVQEGDVLFSIAGVIGRVTVVEKEHLPANLNQALAIIRPKKSNISSRYIANLLRSHDSQFYLKSRIVESVQANLSLTELRRFPVEKISLEEQDKRNKNLDFLEDYSRSITKTSQFSQGFISSIFHSWFIDFDPVKARAEGKLPYGMDEETAALFPDTFEDSDFGLIPKGWKLQQLSDIAQIVDCSHATKPEPIGMGYGVLLHVWNIDDSGGITLHETFEVEENEFNSWASRMVLSEGDCVVTKTGRVAAVGRIPHNLDRNLAMGRNMIGIRMENAPAFLYAYLMSPLKEIEVIKWLNSGTVMPSLHVKYAERLNVIVPNKDILAKFEEIVEPLIRLIDDSRANSVSLSSYRDALLPRLMSGELKVN